MSNPIVLITGGNNGIGFHTCLKFASEGNVHVIVGSRSQEKGEAAAAEIRRQHPSAQVSVAVVDLNSEASIEAAAKQVEAQHGRLDTLINNAGVCPTEMSGPIMRDCFDTNVFGPALTTRAFAPLLRKSASPRVIYVTSMLGSIGGRADPSDAAEQCDYKVYRMSKAATNMLAVCDAWQYRSDGILVFTMCPGAVQSDLAGERKAKEDGGAPLPTKSAAGLWSIHKGEQDAKHSTFLEANVIADGGPQRPW